MTLRLTLEVFPTKTQNDFGRYVSVRHKYFLNVITELLTDGTIFLMNKYTRVRSIVLKLALTISDSGCYSLTGSVDSAYRSKLLLLFIYFICWKIHGKIIQNNNELNS